MKLDLGKTCILYCKYHYEKDLGRSWGGWPYTLLIYIYISPRYQVYIVPCKRLCSISPATRICKNWLIDISKMLQHAVTFTRRHGNWSSISCTQNWIHRCTLLKCNELFFWKSGAERKSGDDSRTWSYPSFSGEAFNFHFGSVHFFEKKENWTSENQSEVQRGLPSLKLKIAPKSKTPGKGDS